MNAEHLEICGSEGWREVLRDLILTLPASRPAWWWPASRRAVVRFNDFGWAAHAVR